MSVEPMLCPRRAIIVAVSSDIGSALATRWIARGCAVFGTYRSPSPVIEQLRASLTLCHCNLADSASVAAAARELAEAAQEWDTLVLCPGTLDPVGAFVESSFDAWEESQRVNLTAPLRLVHDLLPMRNRAAEHGPCVLFFAGSGTNGTAVNYSAYTAAKIGLIKVCELLDAEMPDTRFTILGTGWVRTKIHEATLRAGVRAGANYQRVVERLSGQDWTPLERVLDCCDWVVRSPRAVVGGRNFSIVNDRWGEAALEERLTAEPNMYKLRRYGNDWVPLTDATPTMEGRV
jgi:NAD(P)-dependent dehydrogenase (short-subunit alcohol dehydrogenase family)